MYCTQCGKEIDYEALLCDECLGKSMRNRENVRPTAPAQTDAERVSTELHIDPALPTDASPADAKKNRMYKFPLSLTATILSFVAFIMLSVASNTSTYGAYLIGSIISACISIAGLVIGIIALKSVVRYKKENDLTPIAPLVLSIVGTAYGGLTLLISLISICAVLTAVL